MASTRCERCGERFNSKYNYELHRDLGVCEPSEETSSADEASESPAERRDESPARRTHATNGATGTVCAFDEDGGFGFVTTTDVTREVSEETDATEDVFFHVTDADAERFAVGDRVEFDVVDTERGPRCENVEILERDGDRGSYDEPEDGQISNLGFGHQSDDTKYGYGKSSPTESDIDSFRDERKFR